MAIVRVASGTRTTSNTTVVSSSFTPTAGRTLYVAASALLGSSIVFSSITDSGSWGLSWETTNTTINVGGARVAVVLGVAYVPAGSYSAGTITVTWDSTSSSQVLLVEEDDGTVDTADVVRNGSASTASGVLSTLDGTLTLTPISANRVIAMVASRASTGDLTVGGSGGFTEVDELANAASTVNDIMFMARTGSTSTTFDFAGLNTSNNVALAFEINATAPSGHPAGRRLGLALPRNNLHGIEGVRLI